MGGLLGPLAEPSDVIRAHGGHERHPGRPRTLDGLAHGEARRLVAEGPLPIDEGPGRPRPAHDGLGPGVELAQLDVPDVLGDADDAVRVVPRLVREDEGRGEAAGDRGGYPGRDEDGLRVVA